MNKHGGSFQGIDTWYVTSFGDFRYSYEILVESYSVPIAYQPDVIFFTKFRK